MAWAFCDGIHGLWRMVVETCITSWLLGYDYLQVDRRYALQHDAYGLGCLECAVCSTDSCFDWYRHHYDSLPSYHNGTTFSERRLFTPAAGDLQLRSLTSMQLPCAVIWEGLANTRGWVEGL